MTPWRLAYALARIIPVVVSFALVAVANAAWPGFALGWLIVVLVATATGRDRLLRVVARRPSVDVLEVLRSTGGMVPALRGRLEPRWWVAPSIRSWLRMTSPRDVVISTGLVAALQAGRIAPDRLAIGLATEHGRLRVTGTWMVRLIDALCLPSTLVARLLPRGLRRPGQPLQYWLATLAGIALIRQGASGRWGTGLGLATLAAGVLLGPIAEARWQARLDRLAADAVVAAGLDQGTPVVAP